MIVICNYFPIILPETQKLCGARGNDKYSHSLSHLMLVSVPNWLVAKLDRQTVAVLEWGQNLKSPNWQWAERAEQGSDLGVWWKGIADWRLPVVGSWVLFLPRGEGAIGTRWGGKRGCFPPDLRLSPSLPSKMANSFMVNQGGGRGFIRALLRVVREVKTVPGYIICENKCDLTGHELSSVH